LMWANFTASSTDKYRSGTTNSKIARRLKRSALKNA
jgi:hypothetical protein